MKIASIFWTDLKQLFTDVVEHEYHCFYQYDYDSQKEVLASCDVLCAGPWIVNKPGFLEACPNVKWIHFPTAGYDNVDVHAFHAQNIILTNSRGVHSIPIAEDVVCKILFLARNYSFYFDKRNEGKWEKPDTIYELDGKTALILGTGSIGLEVAKRLKSFTMRTIGINTTGREAPFFDEVYPGGKLNDLLAGADVVICALPLDSRTKGILGFTQFNLMKHDSFLINVARGGHVVTSELIRALEERTIGGAALDVTDPEPLPKDHRLRSLPNILITPHQAGDSDQRYERMLQLFKHNLESFPDTSRMNNVIK